MPLTRVYERLIWHAKYASHTSKPWLCKPPRTPYFLNLLSDVEAEIDGIANNASAAKTRMMFRKCWSLGNSRFVLPKQAKLALFSAQTLALFALHLFCDNRQ